MKKPGASQGQSASELISKRIAKLGDWLTVLKPVVKRAQGQNFDLAAGLLTVGAVSHDPRQCGNLRKPTPIFLLLKLYLQHGSILSTTNVRLMASILGRCPGLQSAA